MTPTEHAFAYSLFALWALIWGGNWLCRKLLAATSGLDEPADRPETDPKAGRIIGGLERIILAGGILLQSWEVVAAVIALKSVARFKELEKKPFAEYFLVGSLFSLFWAFLVTMLWIAYDQHSGANLRDALLSLVASPAG